MNRRKLIESKEILTQAVDSLSFDHSREILNSTRNFFRFDCIVHKGSVRRLSTGCRTVLSFETLPVFLMQNHCKRTELEREGWVGGKDKLLLSTSSNSFN